MLIRSPPMSCFDEACVIPSSFIPTLLELALALLLLTELAISYLTSVIIKSSGLHPPCLSEGRRMKTATQVPKAFSHGRYIKKGEKLAHHLLPGDTWNDNASPTCSTCSSNMDENSSTYFNSSSTHSNRLLEEDISHRSSYLECKKFWDLKNSIHCFHCSSSSFQGSLARKRKLASIWVEEVPDEDGVYNEPTGFTGIESQISSKVFPEDMLIDHRQNHGELLEKPFSTIALKNLNDYKDEFHGKVDDEPSLDSELQAKLSSELTFLPDRILEEVSLYSGPALKDTILKSTSENGGVVLDDSILEHKNDEYDLLETQNSQILSVIPPGEYLTQIEKQETELAVDVNEDLLRLEKQETRTVSDIKSDVRNDSHNEFENDLEILRKSLNSQRKVVNAIYLELEQERSASAMAASKTMTLITQLQKEKAALQMEASQFQRIAEEKAFYDQESLDILKDILLKREAEELALQKEVELYRQRLLKDRIDVWGKTKENLDDGYKDRDQLGGKEVLLLKDCGEANFSEHEADQGILFMNMASAKEEDPSEEDSRKGLLSTDSQSYDARNSLENLSSINAHDALDAKFKEKQQLDDLICRNSRQIFLIDNLDNKDSSSGGKHVKYMTDNASGQLHQGQLLDEPRQCYSLPTDPVRRLNFNGENKWKVMLQQIAVLESQILHLRVKQYSELSYDTPINDKSRSFGKDLLLEGTAAVNPSGRMLRSRDNQGSGNFSTKQEYSPDNGVKEDCYSTFESPLEDSLACKINQLLPSISENLEICTPCITRELSGISIGQKYENSASSLGLLEVDRELIYQSTGSRKEERAEAELLQEIADQLQELHSFISEDFLQQLT